MTEQLHITAQDYFDLPETTQITELIHGEIIVSPTPVPEHQRIVFRVARLIDDLISNGEVFIAPMSVYLDEGNVVEPDVLWASADGECKVGEKYLEGVPDLVVEVFSPSTAKRDKVEKFGLYEKFGVKEYWMIDPSGEYIEVWVLDGGKFIRQGVYGNRDVFKSAILDDHEISLVKIFGTQ